VHRTFHFEIARSTQSTVAHSNLQMDKWGFRLTGGQQSLLNDLPIGLHTLLAQQLTNSIQIIRWGLQAVRHLQTNQEKQRGT